MTQKEMTLPKRKISGKDNGRPAGIRLSRGDIAFNIVNYTVFILITLACIFPFYYLFINTISSNELVRLGKIQLYPQEIHFQNYVQVMKIPGILDALFVSVARTVLGTIWTVGGCAFLGYLCTKQEMWLRKLWYRLIIITMYFSAGLIPWYMNLRMLGFLDNFWVYVIPGGKSNPGRRRIYPGVYLGDYAADYPDSGDAVHLLRGRPVEQLYGHHDADALREVLHASVPALQVSERSVIPCFAGPEHPGFQRSGQRGDETDGAVRADDCGDGGYAADPVRIPLLPAVLRQRHYDRRRERIKMALPRIYTGSQ